MVAARARGLRPGSVVRAVLRLALLVGIGFGAGLLIGVVSEEPELLAGHLRGEGESVPLVAEPVLPEEAGTGDGPETPGPAIAAAQGQTTAGEIDREVISGSAPRATGVQAGRVALLEAAAEDSTPRLPVVAAALAPSGAAPEAGDRSNARESSARWAIQVGAFSDESAAIRLAEGLAVKGYSVELIPATSETRRWRVRVQPVEGETRARELADRLKQEERLPTWVTPMEAGSGS
jgi:cell division septation protein DedD